jgi:hypothetical protein
MFSEHTFWRLTGKDATFTMATQAHCSSFLLAQ